MEYSKRQSQQEDTDDQKGVQIRAHDSKRRREDSQQSDTLRIISFLRSLVHITSDDIEPYMKDLVQRLVREELECKLPRPINNQIGISGSKPFRLVFNNELPDTIYTYSKIKAKDNTPLEVVLFDTESKSIVAEGSLSSIKIEICVLDGEFGSINGREDWSEDEFNAKILRPRDNRGRLLKGDTIITLENGVGYITNLQLTDNSSWRNTRKFSLGAKQSNLKDAINIREGRTKPFTVKDTRGEKYQKHDTPFLNDETWRLKYISKNGSERLLKHGIKTVEDLLKEYETNPSSLLEKFGKIPKKKKEEIIKIAKKAKHTKTCVAEATFDGQNYHSEKNTLVSNQKEAYKNLKDPVPIETITHEKTLAPVNAQYYSASNQDVPQLDFSIARQECISRRNWSAGGQFVDGYILSPSDDKNVSNFLSDINPDEFIFPNGDEAEYCNSSSFPNSALNISDKGKSKMV